MTLKKVVLDPANSRIILQPFNMDYDVQIIDPDQGLAIYLIGILSLQLCPYFLLLFHHSFRQHSQCSTLYT